MGAIPSKFCCTTGLATDPMLHLLTLDKGNFILTINFLLLQPSYCPFVCLVNLDAHVNGISGSFWTDLPLGMMSSRLSMLLPVAGSE